MKRLLFVSLVAASLTCPLLAQTDTPAASPAPASTPAPAPSHPAPLTKEQRAQLQKARETALKNDTDLAAANKDLDALRKELAAKQRAFQEKLNAAMVKADPGVESFLPKLPPAPDEKPAANKPAKAPKTPPAST